MKYREKMPVVEATQWFKNGDHPQDACATVIGSDGKTTQGEGHVVRYYRRPDRRGDSLCPFCGVRTCEHGWTDSSTNNPRVCPSNWVISVGIGHYHVMTNERFLARYEPVEE